MQRKSRACCGCAIPRVPLYGLGESMGGAVLLHALQRQPRGWIDGVALGAGCLEPQ